MKPVLPCEGVGYEVGSMAIIKGARNLDAAKRFYDWALTAEAQQIGLDVKEYAIPTNRSVVLPPMVPKLTDIKVINYDFAKYGASETSEAPARALGEGNQRGDQVTAGAAAHHRSSQGPAPRGAD